jgi:DNA polymerase-3 subunit epsilon
MAARQIILDTETTGLNARLGDRVIEIGCIELVNRRPTGNHFHRYLNPGRDIDEGASKIHGLTREDLADKPRFAEIANEFLEFLRGAELVIHNAPFDVEFLDRELELVDLGKLSSHCAGVVDTLAMARELHPGKKNNLNALCERYAVDNSKRTLHGALLDASLLSEVYLTMTRGQESLIIEPDEPVAAEGMAAFDASMLIVLLATEAEVAEHDNVLASIDIQSKGGSLWRRLMAQG